MRIAVASDHADLNMKSVVIDELKKQGQEPIDFGVESPTAVDFPDYAERVGRAMQNQQAERGVLICGSGVGMCIAANKLAGVRASVAHDIYSAHQGVEHDSMNVLCLGSRVIGEELARELVRTFVHAEFQRGERFLRRMGKIEALEHHP